MAGYGEFFEYIIPLLYISNIMGYIHVSIPNLSLVKKIGVILAQIVFVLVYNSGILLKMTYMYFIPVLRGETHKIKGIGVLLMSCCLIKFWVDYIYTILKRGQVKSILKDIEKVRQTLNGKPKLNPSSIRYAVLASIAILLVSITIDSLFTLRLRATFPFTLGYSLETYRIIYMNGTVYTIAGYLRDSYRCINETIESDLIRTHSGEGGGGGGGMEEDANRIEMFDEQISRVHHSHGDKDSINYYKVMHKLSYLVRIHRRISRISTELNEAFAIPLLGNVGISFIMLTLLAYYTSTLYNFMGSEKFLHVLAICLYWEIVYIIEMVLIVHTWSSLEQEAKRTAILINHLINKLDILNNTKFGYKCEEHAQMIALTFYHSQPVFTAYGLFKLDWTLLQMIIGAVATYLVLMIQLD